VAARRDKRGFPTPLELWRRRPALRALVLRLTRERRAGPAAVFADGCLAQPERLAPAKLWTMLSVEGWLGLLERPAAAWSRAGPP
jgi:hypothetical protein